MVNSINIRVIAPEGTGNAALDFKDSFENLIAQGVLPSSLLLGQTYSVDPSISFLVISNERLASSNYLQPDGLYVSLRGASYSGSGQWLDSTTNGINADVNGASFSSSENVFILDGTDESISIPHNPMLGMSASQAITIQVWVNIAELPTTYFTPIFGKLSSSFTYDGYFCAVNPNGTIRSVTNGQLFQRSRTSTNFVSPGTWHLITFVTQLTAQLNTTRVYIDKEVAISTEHGEDTQSESNTFYLGYAGDGLGFSHLRGMIGEMHFYNRALSANEVAANYDFTKAKYILL
jgi:hypothetical protein